VGDFCLCALRKQTALLPERLEKSECVARSVARGRFERRGRVAQ